MRRSKLPLRDEVPAKEEISAAVLRVVRRPVRLSTAWREQVHDIVAASRQQLRDEAPVAAPPQGLGAHQARGRPVERVGEGRLPRLTGHPGRVASERRLAQAREPLLAGFAASTPAELHRVDVRDVRVGKRPRERFPVELRVSARSGKLPDVDEGARADLRETVQELLGGPGPVTDREDAHAAYNRPSADNTEAAWLGR